ncbi:hypothetical protein LCGC14_2034750 [marine sediment metagenome]|uniref:Uncharacterized protein n=1 Tax=marine sediment metagenome TaxID=412755 RepID=A0A0F9ETK8_9ZZZZ
MEFIKDLARVIALALLGWADDCKYQVTSSELKRLK